MEDLVVENLINGEREAQVQAANELSKLSAKQRHKLAERGVISSLVSMLQSQDFEAIQAALLALLSLAFGSERNKIRIVKAGVVTVLLELLHCGNELLIELSIAAMLVLSSCRANKPAIASSGAVQIFVEILNADCTDSNPNSNININSFSMQAKIDIISTLQNLSTCHEIIPTIISSGAIIYTLLQLIHISEKPSELTEKAMALLEKIVSSSEMAIQETAGTNGAIRAIVEAMEDGSAQCKEYAVGILLHICGSCRDKYRGLILREGVMPALLQLSVDGTWGAKKLAGELLMLLRDYSNYASTSKESKHEVIEQIMKVIDAEGEKVAGATLRLVEEMIAKLSI